MNYLKIPTLIKQEFFETCLDLDVPFYNTALNYGYRVERYSVKKHALLVPASYSQPQDRNSCLNLTKTVPYVLPYRMRRFDFMLMLQYYRPRATLPDNMFVLQYEGSPVYCLTAFPVTDRPTLIDLNSGQTRRSDQIPTELLQTMQHLKQLPITSKVEQHISALCHQIGVSQVCALRAALLAHGFKLYRSHNDCFRFKLGYYSNAELSDIIDGVLAYSAWSYQDSEAPYQIHGSQTTFFLRAETGVSGRESQAAISFDVTGQGEVFLLAHGNW